VRLFDFILAQSVAQNIFIRYESNVKSSAEKSLRLDDTGMF